ncbi:MAG: potassium channel family protein [Bacteroidia bacterium]
MRFLEINFQSLSNTTNTSTAEPVNGLSIAITILSVYILIAMIADTFFNLPENVSHILAIVDDLVCIIFLIEFIIRFKRAENKWTFMKWGWIDLLSSIPAIDIFRYGRLLRLIRLLRILRAFQSTRHLIKHIMRKRKEGTFTAAALVAVLLLIFSSIAIVQVENDPESNIKTGEDALWWAFSTITTVGYGDRYPVTTEGRFIAVILMTVGVGLFGTFAAFVTTWFMGKPAENENMSTENSD